MKTKNITNPYISKKATSFEFFLLHLTFAFLLVLAFFYIKQHNQKTQDQNYSYYSHTSNNNDYYLKNTASCSPNAFNMAVIQPETSGLWSDAATWPGGKLPTTNDDVIIPAGRTVTLLGTCKAKSITVNGKLTAISGQANNAGFNLEAKWIMLMGANAALEIGTKASPYISTDGGIITLMGTDPKELIPNSTVNSKAIMVMDGATLNLQGKVIEKTWTQINKTVKIGDTQLEFKEDMDIHWKIGDQIVLASSDFDMNETEQLKIKRFINSKTIELEQPLKFDHFGELQSYKHGKDASITWSLDERAEVGLLSHNITIKGDMSGSSLNNGFGGHIMVMERSKAYVDGVELYQMGQRGVKGRYPFHWHGLRDATGQYFNRNSVHHTFNRAVTVHATSNVDLIANIAYDNLGHAFFLEDGTEQGVRMLYNVGLVTRRPSAADAVLPSDITNGRNSSGPATFWITNPNNQINGNIAGGSDGSGIWYAPFNSPNGLFYDSKIENAYLPIPAGFIDNNVAHSSRHGFIFGAGPIHGTANEEVNQNGYVRPPANSNATLKNITVFKNDLGIYHRTENGESSSSTIINTIIADNRVGEASTWKAYYDRILWVMASKNFSKDYGTEGGVGGDVSAAHIVYDGPVITTNSHFGGTTPAGQSLFDQWGGNIKYTSHSFQNTTSDNGAIQYNWRRNYTSPVWFLASVRDIDGALTGRANSSVSIDHPYLMDASTVRKTDNGAQTDLKFAYVEIRASNEDTSGQTTNRKRPHATVIRADGPQYSDQNEIEGYPITVVVDKPEMRSRFVLKKEVPSSLRFDVYSMDAGENIMLEVPNVPSTMKLYNGDENGFAGGKNFSEVQQISTKTIPALTSATTSGISWYWKDGTAFIKYRGANGFDYKISGTQDVFFLCLGGNCVNTTAVPVTLSTFTQLETRATLEVSGTGTIDKSAITNSNGQDSYTITKVGANDACVEYHLKFDNQNWQNMEAINIKGSGLQGSEVFIFNPTIGPVKIGEFCTNDPYVKFGLSQKEKLENVNELIIKTCESGFGAATNQVKIDEITFGTIASPTVNDCYSKDNDGDGLTRSEEDLLCKSDNDAGDFNFDFNNSKDGFAESGINATASTDEAFLLRADNQANPYIERNGFSMKGNDIPKIVLYAQSQAQNFFQLYWTTQNSPTYTEAKSLKSNNIGSKYENHVFDLANHPDWKNQIITGLRIDFPTNANASAIHTWINYFRGSKFAEDACKSVPPELYFLNPTVTQLKAGDDLGVVVSATPASRKIISDVQLYINNTLVRKSTQPRYDWGAANPTPGIDPMLRNMAVGTYTLKTIAIDNLGVTSEKTLKIEVKATLSISDYNLKKEFKIHPNPSENGIFYLSEETDHEVYNIQGRLIIDGKKSSKIDLSDKPKGVYILNIDNIKVKLIR